MAGPMDDVSIDKSRDWRDWLTEELKKVKIETLNPISKYGDKYGNVRQKFAMWGQSGNIDAIRGEVSSHIIPPDMEMVEECDFITLYISPKGYEICGSYGEMTVGFYLGNIFSCPRCEFKYKEKPIYIVTKRRLKPVNVPKWAIGCSTKIFSNWEDYLKYIYEHWVNDG